MLCGWWWPSGGGLLNLGVERRERAAELFTGEDAFAVEADEAIVGGHPCLY